jgi:hypothetical protein
MPPASEWALVLATVLGFSGFLYIGFQRWNFHAFVMGKREVPIRLPLFSFCWTAVTALLFFGWREIQGAAPTEPSHPYFRVGWGPTLVLFNVSINTWWKYSIIQCYQVKREGRQEGREQRAIVRHAPGQPRPSSPAPRPRWLERC